MEVSKFPDYPTIVPHPMDFGKVRLGVFAPSLTLEPTLKLGSEHATLVRCNGER